MLRTPILGMMNVTNFCRSAAKPHARKSPNHPEGKRRRILFLVGKKYFVVLFFVSCSVSAEDGGFSEPSRHKQARCEAPLDGANAAEELPEFYALCAWESLTGAQNYKLYDLLLFTDWEVCNGFSDFAATELKVESSEKGIRRSGCGCVPANESSAVELSEYIKRLLSQPHPR